MAITINGPLSKENSTLGIIVTVLFILFGLYIGYKHYKDSGFWWGVLALVLISSSLFIGKDNTTKTI